MDRNESALVEETKALINEVEAGETTHAAWVAIRDRVMKLCEQRTQAEVGALLDHRKEWVRDVVRDWPRVSSTPFARDAKPGRRDSVEQAEAKKVLADPEKRAKVIGSLTPTERAEVAASAAVATPPEQRQAVTDAIHKKEDEEFFEDPGKAEGHRKQKARAMKDEAWRRTFRAWMNLGARWHYYADVPFKELEVQQLTQIKDMAEAMLRGEEMDDDLRELVADAKE